MRHTQIATSVLAFVALGALGALPAHAQEPEVPEVPPVEQEQEEQTESERPTLPEGFRRPTGQDELIQELRDLFHQVERKLEEIDVQLADAGAGEVPLDAVEDAGLDDLLRDSRSKSEESIAGINRILEIAQLLGGQGGGPRMEN